MSYFFVMETIGGVACKFGRMFKRPQKAIELAASRQRPAIVVEYGGNQIWPAVRGLPGTLNAFPTEAPAYRPPWSNNSPAPRQSVRRPAPRKPGNPAQGQASRQVLPFGVSVR